MTPLIVTLDTPGITDVPGFEVAGVPCDIREKQDLKRLDLALLFSLRPRTAAGTFTKNAVKAPPVLLCQKHLAEGGPFHGIIANSGNANACTGAEGLADAQATAQRAAASLNLKPTSFLSVPLAALANRCRCRDCLKGSSVPSLKKGARLSTVIRALALSSLLTPGRRPSPSASLTTEKAFCRRHGERRGDDSAQYGDDVGLFGDRLFRAP